MTKTTFANSRLIIIHQLKYSHFQISDPMVIVYFHALVKYFYSLFKPPPCVAFSSSLCCVIHYCVDGMELFTVTCCTVYRWSGTIYWDFFFVLQTLAESLAQISTLTTSIRGGCVRSCSMLSVNHPLVYFQLIILVSLFMESEFSQFSLSGPRGILEKLGPSQIHSLKKL